MSVLHLPLRPSHHTQTGFTVMEVMIVVMMIALLMLGATSVFITLLTGRAKNASNQIIKAEGEYALERMEFMIRNATRLEANPGGVTCASDMNDITIRSVDGKTTRFYRQQDASDNNKLKIASNSGVFLTSGAIDTIPNWSINCSESPDRSSRYVTVTFVLRKNGKQQLFRTSVNLRNAL